MEYLNDLLINLVMNNPLISFSIRRVTGAIKLRVSKMHDDKVYSKEAMVLDAEHIVSMFEVMLKDLYDALDS